MGAGRDLRLDEVEDPRLAPTRCQAEDCNRSTRRRKPYCPEHVELHDYVAGVLAGIAARERDLQRWLAEPRRKDVSGPLRDDLLELLAVSGERTLVGAARALHVPVAALERLSSALAREGTVSLGRTRRGNTTAEVIP